MACRLCLHTWPGGERHLDLFVEREPGAGMLETYEVSAAFLDVIERELSPEMRGHLHLRARAASQTEPDASRAALAVRKADHRRHYWQYAGPISGGRGVLTEVGRGVLEGETAVRFVMELREPGPD